MRATFMCLLVVAVLAGSSLPAAADESAFAGYWDGSIALPGTAVCIREYGEIDETISPEVLEIIYEWIAERFVAD